MHKQLVFLGLLFAALIAEARPVNELYSQRPDVLRFHDTIRLRRTLASKRARSVLDENWYLARNALVRFLPALNFYPDNYEFYFLGRDGEPLFDLAKSLWAQNPQFAKRIHLINVSRPSLKQEGLWNYLAQEGISVKQAARGKRFLLVDTGMRGRIPDELRKTAPASLRNAIQAHFLLSANRSYPSSRGFLSMLEPDTLRSRNLGSFESLILEFENLPHFTHSVVSFQNRAGHWEAITGPSYEAPFVSPAEMGFGGGQTFLSEATSRDPDAASILQADLYRFSQETKVRQRFEKLGSVWTSLRRAYERSVALGDHETLMNALRDLNMSDPVLKESIVRDVADILRTNDPLESGFQIRVGEALAASASFSDSCERSLWAGAAIDYAL